MTVIDSIFKTYLIDFSNNGEWVLKAICGCYVPSQVVLSKYKSLPPIEGLPEIEKTELKKYVIEMFPEKSVEDLVDAAKIVYTIGTLL